ncbi:MAG: TIGR02117 family protein [Mesorhizobium sp.]
MRALKFVGFCVLALVLFGLVGAVVPRPFIAGTDDGSAGATRRVLVLSNPIHTDIAFPADPDVLEKLSFLTGADLPISDPAVRWIVLGWGGRAFYIETPTWSELKPLPLLKGLTIDRAAMHVTLAGEIDMSHPTVTAIDVSPANFVRMLDLARATFKHDPMGEPILIDGRSYGDLDRFYEAEGWFSALRGCNTWTAAVLREGGLRTGVWNPMPQSLVWSLRQFNGTPVLAN